MKPKPRKTRKQLKKLKRKVKSLTIAVKVLQFHYSHRSSNPEDAGS